VGFSKHVDKHFDSVKAENLLIGWIIISCSS